MRRYAEGLEADIVALQEVHSVAALEQVFDNTKWQFILSDRQDSPAYECRGSNHTSTQQKTAFAIRKGLKVNAHQDLASLALQRVGLRHGLEVNVATPLGDISLLNVHLKSGCFVANYSQSDKPACDLIGAQLPVLKAWLQQQQNQPAIVLGDFNHRLAANDNRFWSELSEGIQSYNVTATMKGVTHDTRHRLTISSLVSLYMLRCSMSLRCTFLNRCKKIKCSAITAPFL